ncbi:histone-lysine N-methyltransferase [Adlercreutzia sp. ZJ141]|uniref:histone-lysine N-methyltransferase n=1 Tax=Adlercreutzia sp. ZJ141 TaxID=2709406 RepID=UPI001F14DB8E|nr:histone-lysine N-methyltransferase [Adlercreutzia sp. ZJ141]
MAKHAADSNFKALRGRRSDYDGNHMGLTEAFAPVSPTTPQLDDDSGNRMGLTEAFAPVTASGMPARTPTDPLQEEGRFAAEAVDTPRHGRHGRHGRTDEQVPNVAYPVSNAGAGQYQHKSRRMRKVLIAVIVLLVLLVIALGYFSVQLFTESKTLASQQTQEQQSAQEVGAMQQEGTSDVAAGSTKKTDVVNLTGLLGVSLDEAIAKVGHGASVTATREVDQEGSDVKTEVTLALTDEPADTRSGTPSVFLSLNADGAVIRAGYSAATSALGYGSLSFADAVQSEHIIENALREAGLSVDDGAAVLPENKGDYSTYDTDGTTLMKETCSFSGTGTVDGAEHSWDAVLLYDYVAANTSGNLNDTIRVLYIYVNA